MVVRLQPVVDATDELYHAQGPDAVREHVQDKVGSDDPEEVARGVLAYARLQRLEGWGEDA